MITDPQLHQPPWPPDPLSRRGSAVRGVTPTGTCASGFSHRRALQPREDGFPRAGRPAQRQRRLLGGHTVPLPPGPRCCVPHAGSAPLAGAASISVRREGGILPGLEPSPRSSDGSPLRRGRGAPAIGLSARVDRVLFGSPRAGLGWQVAFFPSCPKHRFVGVGHGPGATRLSLASHRAEKWQ